MIFLELKQKQIKKKKKPVTQLSLRLQKELEQ